MHKLEIKEETIAQNQLVNLVLVLTDLLKEKEGLRDIKNFPDVKKVEKLEFRPDSQMLTKECKFFRIERPDRCRNGTNCKFLHLDPTNKYGA